MPAFRHRLIQSGNNYKHNKMTDIRPSEISAILKSQLANFDTEIKLEEVGTVLQVGDGIARIYGLDNVESNEIISFSNGVEGIVLNLEEDNVGAVLVRKLFRRAFSEGDHVKRTKQIASVIAVGEGLLSEGLSTLDWRSLLDGKGPIGGERFEYAAWNEKHLE
jgi:F-type H+/Na+-transporting ATPase subunit alpha